MQLFLRSLNKTHVLLSDNTTSVADLKQQIEDITGIPSECSRLVSKSGQINEGLVCNCLSEADTLTLLLNINGGMRAKWHKKRMRRLKRKRRKMKQRAK